MASSFWSATCFSSTRLVPPRPRVPSFSQVSLTKPLSSRGLVKLRNRSVPPRRWSLTIHSVRESRGCIGDQPSYASDWFCPAMNSSRLRPVVPMRTIFFIIESTMRLIRTDQSWRQHIGLWLRSTPMKSIVTEVTKDSWENSVMKNDSVVLVEFYASWCGPCRMVHRTIDEIAGEYSDKLNCFVLNTENNRGVADKYKIKVVPVVVLFKNGEKRESIVGTMPKEYYTAAIDRVLSS